MAGVRICWAKSVFTPWWLGLVFVVSISADAGQDAASGASVSPLSSRAPASPDLLVPPSLAIVAGGDFGKLTVQIRQLVDRVALFVEGADETKRLSEEFEPRIVPRRQGGPAAGLVPAIDRRAKADPVVGLRPTFDAKLRRPGELARLRRHDAIFTHDENSPVGGFSELESEAETDEMAQSFEPWPEGESPTTLPTRTETSPQRPAGTTMTMRPAAINQRLMQGATPVLRRAEMLASMTPVRAESTPIEIVALATVPPAEGENPVREPGARTRATAVVATGSNGVDTEKRCLAEAIYFEARGESEQGQAAVAQVVLNRLSSGLYPASICGVVYQNRHRFRACQFSFACEGRALRINDTASWRIAVRIAAEVTAGKIYVDDVGGSTHYHADHVQPRWARRLEKMDVIGHHIFYKLQAGQN
jgi:spore germination cell wall hydrolase CwlJ-like protein